VCGGGAPRHPLPADPRGRLEHLVEAALGLADGVGHVGDVHEPVGVELRPVPQHLDDVGALPDWMAAVMRGWRSLALMNSSVTSAPRALLASGAWRLSSTSASGMKSPQGTIWSWVPWANAGARRAARTPSSPARAGTAAAPTRKRRRDRKAR